MCLTSTAVSYQYRAIDKLYSLFHKSIDWASCIPVFKRPYFLKLTLEIDHDDIMNIHV